ncbi:MAG TPA: hypothetical protein VGO77_25160, partial [Mycobacterium sp.]|nr:hypothetical protein [Mycobacterium sp.]
WGGAETYAPRELQRVVDGAALLLDQRRAQGAVVLEDGHPRAFGMTTFVDEALIEAYLDDPHPHLGKRLLLEAHNPDTTSVLQPHQIAERNAALGLQVVVVNCAMDPATRDPGTVLGAVIAASFHVHRGYRIARYINEVFGEMSVSIIEASRSYEIRRRFELPIDGAMMCSLVGTLTREQAVAWSNPLLAMFAYSPPRLRFTHAEQRVLCEALAGVTDETLSARLSIPVSAVKARWTRIQERVARLAPTLYIDIPETPRHGRGVQTRHLILQYVRDHPSELTPYAWPATRVRQRRVMTRAQTTDPDHS